MIKAGMSGARIILQDLTAAYGRRPAVHHLSGEFEPGSLTAIMGPNGGGKSTLLKSIAGLMRPSEGRVVLDNIFRRDIGYLPQQAEIDRSFPINVADTVALGLWRKTSWWKNVNDAARGKIAEALAQVGLAGYENIPVSDLSVGQFQRVLFARLLVQDAPAILLDEPFAALDAHTSADLIAIVHQWQAEGRTIVAVLHEADLVRTHFPRTLLLAREKIGWGATADVLTETLLDRAKEMAQSWREDDEAHRHHGHGRGHARRTAP